MGTELFDPIKTQARVTRSVLCGFSCGKDSIVTLDLCFRFFDKVQPYFMYYVPGMDFQERFIKKYERKYGFECIRIPHFEVSNFMRYGTFRDGDMSVPIVSVADTYAYLRNLTGMNYIACGERISDSIVRRAMLKKCGSIDERRGRFYPIIYWNKKDILQYIKAKRLVLPLEYTKIGHSFRSLSAEDLRMVKELYPEDYAKLLKIYPFAGAALHQEELEDEKQISGI